MAPADRFTVSKAVNRYPNVAEGKLMSHRMRRREFLVESSRAAVGLPLLALVPSSRGIQKSTSTVTVLRNQVGGGLAAICDDGTARHKCGILRYAAAPA